MFIFTIILNFTAGNIADFVCRRPGYLSSVLRAAQEHQWTEHKNKNQYNKIFLFSEMFFNNFSE